MREYTIAMLLTHGMAAAMTMSIHPIQYNHYYHSNYSYQYIHTPLVYIIYPIYHTSPLQPLSS